MSKKVEMWITMWITFEKNNGNITEILQKKGHEIPYPYEKNL